MTRVEKNASPAQVELARLEAASRAISDPTIRAIFMEGVLRGVEAADRLDDGHRGDLLAAMKARQA